MVNHNLETPKTHYIAFTTIKYMPSFAVTADARGAQEAAQGMPISHLPGCSPVPYYHKCMFMHRVIYAVTTFIMLQFVNLCD